MLTRGRFSMAYLRNIKEKKQEKVGLEINEHHE
jgi:hypothetical protein